MLPGDIGFVTTPVWSHALDCGHMSGNLQDVLAPPKDRNTDPVLIVPATVALFVDSPVSYGHHQFHRSIGYATHNSPNANTTPNPHLTLLPSSLPLLRTPNNTRIATSVVTFINECMISNPFITRPGKQSPLVIPALLYIKCRGSHSRKLGSPKTTLYVKMQNINE